MRRALRWMAWTLLAILTFSFATDWDNWVELVAGPGPIEAGVFYNMSRRPVAGVLVSTSDYKLLAYRWHTDQPFRIMVVRPGQNTVEECKAGPAFTEWFGMVTKLVNGSQLQRPVIGDPTGWTTLEFITNNEFEGEETRLFVPLLPNQPIIAEFYGLPGQYPVDWDPAAFAAIQGGCAALGQRL
jgi:hypothetical protein